MNTNKTLHIMECYFNLPDDFNGSLGDALMLMAHRAKEAELYNEINAHDEYIFDRLKHLINNEKSKCIIHYRILNT